MDESRDVISYVNAVFPRHVSYKSVIELQCFTFFFFNDAATTEIYTLSLHDALPIFRPAGPGLPGSNSEKPGPHRGPGRDRKSTRLNSSHVRTSYAVFCLKKKKLMKNQYIIPNR